MNAEPYWLVGAGFARIGQPEKGMTACKTAIDLNPNMDCGHVCAGLVHMAKGQPKEAVPFFKFALKLNPRFRPFTKEKYLGLAYIQDGRDDLAIEALNRALATAPKDTFANLALTAALALDGQMPEARETLQRYVQNTGEKPPSISSLREALGWMGPNVERMLGGLRDVGVSEG
jgi:tetratricopeptide (TPR) repeat protein